MSPAPILCWAPQRQQIATIRHGARALSIVITLAPTGESVAIAAETDADNTGDVKKVLGDHSHHLIGSFPDVVKAIHKSEAYARRWKRSRARLEKCGCKEVRS